METFTISTACSAGSQAISFACDLLASNYCDQVIAGGIDSISKTAYAGFLRLLSLDESGCHPFDKNRKGIMVGEGAAFFLLRKKPEKKYPLKVYAALKGHSVTNDAYNIVQMRADGAQVKRAMTEALKIAGLEKEHIDLIVAHGTGTQLNDRTEAAIIYDFFQGKTAGLSITAPKGALGHTGGASGAFGLLTGICAIQHQMVPPTVGLNNLAPEIQLAIVKDAPLRRPVQNVMVNSFAFGGTNVILICGKANGKG
jgi:3-oxoacyl-[acyl-carrier-protein] synthase II